MEDKRQQLAMMFRSEDGSEVLEEYIKILANGPLLYYKSIIQYGGKAGESLWTHILNLIFTVEKLRELFKLTDTEMRCLLLALTVHDINKLDRYGKLPNGRENRYANAATSENLREVLEELGVATFFPEWRVYLNDIEYLVDAHQELSLQASQYNQRLLDQSRLDQLRLEGPLRYLMKIADASDNSHSGDYTAHDEKRIRDKLTRHMNDALSAAGIRRRYRFVGHRVSELRGIETNVIHNTIVQFFQASYGKDACIDLLYHPEGVDYLLDKRLALIWTPEELRRLARQIGKRFAQMQSEQLSQFVKAKPSGISVDDAALLSGAPLEAIFGCIRNIVLRKQYKQEWKEERSRLARKDLEEFLEDGHGDEQLQERIRHLLTEPTVVPGSDEALKRGELFMAYRNFLKDYCGDLLKAVRQDAWERVLRLFQVSPETDPLYQLIDPYRRGYVIARDLPERSIDAMIEDALEDMKQLKEEAFSRQKRKERPAEEGEAPSSQDQQEGEEEISADPAYIVDYLERHLHVWDSTTSLPVQEISFLDSLRRYADPKHPDSQCCYCGSPLKAEEWMAIQVPSSIGVQSFSNRLEGGSAREPKRNVCPACRTQFILEKLSWDSHRDKHGSELATFYLHLFPYSFFTQPMFQAWWQSVAKVREGNHTTLFIETRDHRQWQEAYEGFQARLYYTPSRGEGLETPIYPDAVSNIPVMPLTIKGSNYGQKFLLALEKAILLALWFDCRVLFSRLPTPLLNLANERINEEPVALLIENAPQEMSWLLPENALTRQQLRDLCRTISRLHAIAEKLAPSDDQLMTVVYDLVIAAAQDPLELYHTADRLIEAKAAQRRAPGREILLSHEVAPLLDDLLTGGNV